MVGTGPHQFDGEIGAVVAVRGDDDDRRILVAGGRPDVPKDVLAGRDGWRAAETDRQFQIQQDVCERAPINAVLGFVLGPGRLPVMPE